MSFRITKHLNNTHNKPKNKNKAKIKNTVVFFLLAKDGGGQCCLALKKSSRRKCLFVLYGK